MTNFECKYFTYKNSAYKICKLQNSSYICTVKPIKDMKKAIINGLKTNKPTVETGTVVKNIEGNIIEVQNAPRFDGPTVTVKGGNSKEFWAQHPNNGNTVQMSMGAKLLGKHFEAHPEDASRMGVSAEDIAKLKAGETNLPNHTLHHEHTGNKNDCDIQIVNKEDHKQNPHRGGMLTSNQDRMRKEAEKQGTLPKNKFERICNTVNFNAHKHPVTAGAVAGIGTSAMLCGGYAFVSKKLGVEPNSWGYAACLLVGTAMGVLTHNHLNDRKVYL